MIFTDQLPASVEDFNNSLPVKIKSSDKEFIIGWKYGFAFQDRLLGWGDAEECIYCPDKEHFHLIFNVNGYFIISTYNYSEYKGDLSYGYVLNIYASESLAEFIFNYDPISFNKNIVEEFSVPKNELLKKEKYKYFNNYLFVDLPYNEILKTVSEYFHDFLYPIEGSEDKVNYNPLIKKWDKSGHEISSGVSEELFYNATDAMNQSGILLSIQNTKQILFSEELCHNRYSYGSEYDNFNIYAIDRTIKQSPFQKLDIEKIPKQVLEAPQIVNLPNVIRINFNRNNYRRKLGDKITENLVKEFNGKAAQLTHDYNIQGFKASPFLTDEEKFYYLYEYMDSYLDDPLDNDGVSMAQTLIPITWDRLENNSKIFLATGLFQYDKIVKGSQFIPDFSVPSLQFAKCIENEVFNRIVIPFKNHFKKNFTAEDMSKDLNDTNLNRMAKFLIEANKTPPELGSFSYFLHNVINSKKRAKWSVTIRAFKSFADTCADPSFLMDATELYEKLYLIATKYRNGAAHIKVLPLEYLKEFYSLLFENEFIQRLVDSTEIKTHNNT